MCKRERNHSLLQEQCADQHLGHDLLSYLSHQCPIFFGGNGARKTPYFYSLNTSCPICPILFILLGINNVKSTPSLLRYKKKFVKTWEKWGKWDRPPQSPYLYDKTASHFSFIIGTDHPLAEG